MFPFLTTSQEVGIQNALWAGFGWLVVIVFGVYLWRLRKSHGNETAYELALGITYVAAASSLHRTYWWFWRHAKSWGNDEAAAWFVNNAEWLWLCVIGILIGYGLHLRSRLRTLFNGQWWVPVCLWTVALILITLFSYGDM